jgi:hypothetical protein
VPRGAQAARATATHSPVSRASLLHDPDVRFKYFDLGLSTYPRTAKYNKSQFACLPHARGRRTALLHGRPTTESRRPPTRRNSLTSVRVPSWFDTLWRSPVRCFRRKGLPRSHFPEGHGLPELQPWKSCVTETIALAFAIPCLDYVAAVRRSPRNPLLLLRRWLGTCFETRATIETLAETIARPCHFDYLVKACICLR